MESARLEEARTTEFKSGRRCNFWCLAGVFFLLGITGVVVVLVLFLTPGCARQKYGLVFDAGSSHSAMSIYRWAGEKLRGTGEVVEITECEVDGPGISSYKDDPDKAGESLADCLREAERKVPTKRQGKTPIYLGATAGMRILKAENEEKARKVFDSVEKAFEKSNFKYAPGHVRMVSDQEEGVYAWISANLVEGNLGQSGSKTPTSGTLDMGGASTQIAFETSERIEGTTDDNYMDLRLYGYDFKVFTHSYLCFGQNEAIRRYKAQIILNELEKNAGATEFNNPCWHSGNDVKEKVKDVLGQMCTLPIPLGSSLSGDTEITFKGTGNVDNCKMEVSKLLNATECKVKNYTHCFDASFVPTPKGKFLAMSSYFYSSEIVARKDIHMNLNTYVQEADSYCHLPWNTAKTTPGTKETFLARFCFVGLLNVEILANHYGFSGDKWTDLNFVKKVEGVTMGWALGFMTNATNTIPAEATKAIATDLFIALTILFIVLIVIVLILSYHAWSHRRGRANVNKAADNSILSLCCPRK